MAVPRPLRALALIVIVVAIVAWASLRFQPPIDLPKVNVAESDGCSGGSQQTPGKPLTSLDVACTDVGQNPRYELLSRPLGQPPLCGDDGPGERYRLMWLRTFHEPIVISLGIDGSVGRARGRVFDGKGGYELGRAYQDRSTILTPEQLSAFRRSIDLFDFWYQPEDAAPVSVDGSSWTIEGVRNGRYHRMARQGCPPLERQFMALVKALSLEIKGPYY